MVGRHGFVQNKHGDYMEMFAITSVGPQAMRLDRFLDLNGDGTGTKNLIGDYTTPDIAFIQPPAGVVYRIARLIFSVESTLVGMTNVKYGNIATLTTGIEIRIQDDSGTLMDLTDGVPIQSNGHWHRMCFDAGLSSFGAGAELYAARWSFDKAGQFIRLIGDNNERLEVLLSDNLSALDGHYFLVQGYVE